MPNSIKLNILELFALFLVTVAVVLIWGSAISACISDDKQVFAWATLSILGWCFCAKAIALPATISHALRKARTGA